jgi:hypothetical protein
MVKVKGTVKAKVRRNGKPIKAGSTDKKSGGIFTTKVIAISKKTK